MNLIVAIPLEVRLAVLSVLGACLGGLINLGVYRLAWHSRAISPWSRGDPQAPPRRRSDRIPIVGWLGLRREAGLHGTGFWIRPMLLELLTGIGLATLYWWEIGRQGLLPPDAPLLAAPALQAILHAEYGAHVLLVCLLLVASLIDADEKTIPDTITVPGTLLGLVLAAVYPWSLLPEFVPPLDVLLRPRIGVCFPPRRGRFCSRPPRSWPPVGCLAGCPIWCPRESGASRRGGRWPWDWAAGGCGAWV